MNNKVNTEDVCSGVSEILPVIFQSLQTVMAKTLILYNRNSSAFINADKA